MSIPSQPSQTARSTGDQPQRQHCAPILLPEDDAPAIALSALHLQSGPDAVSEAYIQRIIQECPQCLPIREIDPIFVGPIPICRELNTGRTGFIDNFMITATGLPILVECKLWRNPEGRREVVGQILDYAKELSRWSSADLQRAVNERLGEHGNSVLKRVRAIHPTIDEAVFNDALTANLRRGRFLLLIVGDGIREGVEAIAEYLQRHAGLHFSLGLIELPIYSMPDGRRLAVPRVLLKTAVVTRTVIALPSGYSVQDDPEAKPEGVADPDRENLANEQQAFWQEFLTFLKLDDPEQQIPRPARLGYLTFMLPAPAGSSWLTVYRDLRLGTVGVFLSSSRSSAGEYAMRAIVDEWDEIKDSLNGTAKLVARDGRSTIIDTMIAGDLADPVKRARAFAWLAGRVNTFVNVMRPRVRSAAMDYKTSSG